MIAPDLVVDTGYGPLRGTGTATADLWLGVPYAQPPVGPLRWRHARPPRVRREITDARNHGPVCPQPVMPVIDLGAAAVANEDCLYLNVGTPRGAAGSGRSMPVMVWIHGGAYLCGSGSQPLYDPGSLVQSSVARGTPTIIVTVNYRMGAFGFTDLRSMSAGGEQFDANCGLSDVIAALAWVRDNIAAFGGDPGNVTIFGESAGAGVVTTLLASPAARGLFHRAIAQSSPATTVYDAERGERYANMLLAALDPDHVSAARLRGTPAYDLVAASSTVFSSVPNRFPGTIAYAPVVDGDLVPRDPLDAVVTGDAHRVPLLIGTNRHETSLFRFMSTPLMPVRDHGVDAMFTLIGHERPALSIPARDELGASYGHVPSGARSMAISRDIGFRMPALWITESHAQVAPVHLYRFDWATPLLRLLGYGAAHATEVPYVWGNPASSRRDPMYALGGRAIGERVRRRMQYRWLGFAADGVPDTGDPDDVRWDPYVPERHSSLLIDGPTDYAAEGIDDHLLRAWGDEVLSFR
ncbi:carboxylesterase/lipase family protein [Gordonia shandongensis]|uniref:carboxylesterase/lipase family protein n=1 Tax=Gordonia shandongensis TaxID=376351 RepID=UPI0003FB07EB|nr:carboxylesterase/lipase family protein [Gordonia shandongensis]